MLLSLAEDFAFVRGNLCISCRCETPEITQPFLTELYWENTSKESFSHREERDMLVQLGLVEPRGQIDSLTP
jgi:hypothetical protein